MSRNKGYRVDRLRRRRRTKAERWQAWTLYGLAGVVAFAAVLGAWYLGSRYLHKQQKPEQAGYVALIKLSPASGASPVAAALAIRSAVDGQFCLYVVPRELLLTGAQDEYVFAADAMADGTLKGDLERVIRVGIDAEYVVPVAKIAALAGGGSLQVPLDRTVKLDVAGNDQTFKKGKVAVSAAEIPALFAASGPSGEDAAAMQQGLWEAVLQAVALQPADARSRLLQNVTAGVDERSGAHYLSDAFKGLTSGSAVVSLVPSTTRVAEGQFAFVPDPEGIMAQITGFFSGLFHTTPAA